MADYTGVDPQVVRVLETIARVNPPRYQDVGHEQARVLSAAVAAQRAERHGVEPVKSVEDRVIAGPGGDLRLRVYWPQDAAHEDKLPVVLFVHGGGWTVGSVDTYDGPARATCNRTGAVLVSVDYRLAPEHPYPAALDDGWAALRWTAEHAASLGGDPARIGVWGDSAGGNICAALTLRARDAGGPPIKAQCLVYVSVDASKPYRSAEEFAEGFVLTAATSRWFSNNYLPEFAMRLEPGASPLLADSHAGLPPAVIAVGSHDVLRDHSAVYAEKLRADGVAVWHRVYDGLVHTFYELAAYVDAAREARDEICAQFRTLLLAE
ncbi:MAG TPA: alpha/beta hydrolase [Egibacteraceae bacterium]|nr:alpha/beta hydrolase [Egibacteraceae bacterium]